MSAHWKLLENNLKLVTLGECFTRLGWLLVVEDRAFVKGFNQGLDEGYTAGFMACTCGGGWDCDD